MILFVKDCGKFENTSKLIKSIIDRNKFKLRLKMFVKFEGYINSNFTKQLNIN